MSWLRQGDKDILAVPIATHCHHWNFWVCAGYGTAVCVPPFL
jgi:hypothetical protein